jgi:hypothetical protein
MKLVFQNKILMGIEAMLAEGDKKGGVPKHIIIDSQEATELLVEVKYLKVRAEKDKTGPHHIIEFAPRIALTGFEDQLHPSFLIGLIDNNEMTTLPPQTITALLRFWEDEDLKVFVKYGAVRLVPILLPISNQPRPPATNKGLMINEWTK